MYVHEYHDGTTQGSIILNALCENYFFRVNDRIKNNTDQRQAEKNGSHCVEQGMAFNKQFHTYNASECKLKHGSIKCSSCWCRLVIEFVVHALGGLGAYTDHMRHVGLQITLRTDLSKLYTDINSRLA